jgi:hypothetical protein
MDINHLCEWQFKVEIGNDVSRTTWHIVNPKNKTISYTFLAKKCVVETDIVFHIEAARMSAWPSGLRRQTQEQSYQSILVHVCGRGFEPHC